MKNISNPNTKPIILVTMICLLSLAGCIYSNHRLKRIVEENKSKTELKEEQKSSKKISNEKISNEEKKLTDTVIISIIKSKQKILNNYTDSDIVNKKSFIYEKNITNKELDETKKLVAIIYTIFEEEKYTQLDSSKYPNIEQNPDGATNIIEENVAKESYRNTFGTDLNVATPFPDAIKNNFYYNDEYKVYVINGGFGGACSEGTKTYDYDYKEDDNNIYVYTSVAYYKGCPQEVFKDIEFKEQYPITEEPFDLNEKNYNEFYQYRIAYKKNNNNYIFEKIEKIN